MASLEERLSQAVGRTMTLHGMIRKRQLQVQWNKLKARHEQRQTYHSTLDPRIYKMCPQCGKALPTTAPCTFWKLDVPGVG